MRILFYKIVWLTFALLVALMIVFIPLKTGTQKLVNNVSADSVALCNILFPSKAKKSRYTVKVGRYLGNNKNNFYGNSGTSKLHIFWKKFLGSGQTVVSSKEGVQTWFGAGWTGQPLIIDEKDTSYLIHGAFDHKLRKINAETGKTIWTYSFDDVIKGTGSVFRSHKFLDSTEELYIIQGSRKGVENSFLKKSIYSLRAISFLEGKELWRMNSKKTNSWSRDVDASALVFDTLAYIGLENGIFKAFYPDSIAAINDYFSRPVEYSEHMLYAKSDIVKHGRNLVTESSPCKLGNHIYIASGSGHLYAYNVLKDSIDWDLYLGADIDGSPVVTYDSCILVSLEKQYIKGNGGVLKINPFVDPENSIVWFFPVKNKTFGKWQGGIIGSVAVTDSYSDSLHLAAFSTIEGTCYLVYHDSVTHKQSLGPLAQKKYFKPKLFDTYNTGPSISTPVFDSSRLVVAGYSGIYIFQWNQDRKLEKLDYKPGVFESTPLVYDHKLYISSRDGYLYCFYDSTTIKKEITIADKYSDNQVNTALILMSQKINVIKLFAAAISEQISLKREKVDQYCIVAGTYKTIERAENWKAALRKKGYESVIVENNNLYYNVLNDYSSIEKAYARLMEIRSSSDLQVWVMNKK